jgi:CHASE3 domain sensor protein
MPPKLTNEIINAAIIGFEEQKRQIDIQLKDLRAMLSGVPVEAAVAGAVKPARRKVSAAGRKAMALAQQKRWAAKKAVSEPEKPVAAKPKRKMSAAGRAAIAAAVKKRWAAKKAEAAKK